MTAMVVEQRSIVLHSKWVFVALFAGSLLYAFVLLELACNLPNGMFVFGLYSVLGIGLAYALWVSAYVIELTQDEFAVRPLFGLLASTRLKMKDARRVLVRPNNFKRVTRVMVEFSDGGRVQLHQYQQNFDEARVFLGEQLGSVPSEVQSKWAL